MYRVLEVCDFGYRARVGGVGIRWNSQISPMPGAAGNHRYKDQTWFIWLSRGDGDGHATKPQLRQLYLGSSVATLRARCKPNYTAAAANSTCDTAPWFLTGRKFPVMSGTKRPSLQTIHPPPPFKQTPSTSSPHQETSSQTRYQTPQTFPPHHPE